MSALPLKPCPFCGHETPEFERMGTPRQSCIVACGNCGARHESSDEGDRCGSSWNQREYGERCRALPAEPVLWQYRLANPGDEDNEWREVKLRNPYTDTLAMRVEELRGYTYNGKPCYEVRALVVAAPQPDGAPKGGEHG